MTLAEVRKALAAASAAATVAIAGGLITGDLAVWVTGAIATVTAALATYLAPPNAAPDTPLSKDPDPVG